MEALEAVPGSVAGATQAGEPVIKINSIFRERVMREEKSEEPIPLSLARARIREWRVDEVLLEGECEVRPCQGCRIRLKADIGALGHVLPCPQCGARARTLAAAGPFASHGLDAPAVHRPAPPIELRPTSITRFAQPPEAPVVPYRSIDPVDDRSPMVNAVAQLQWIGGAFLVAVILQQLGMHWKREYVSEIEQQKTYWTATVRAMLALLLFGVAGGLNDRKRTAWVMAILLATAVITATGWHLYERASNPNGFRARFDFGVLLELPVFLIAIFTFIVLATPRYAAEFFTTNSNQSGTIEVPAS